MLSERNALVTLHTYLVNENRPIFRVSSTDLYISVIRIPGKKSFSFVMYRLGIRSISFKLTVTGLFICFIDTSSFLF